jgi:transposase
MPGHAHDLRENLSVSGIIPVIPSKSNRKFPPEFDNHTYKWRHLIENYFQKLKEFKRIALRTCKTDQSFSSMIYLAAAIINSR